MNIKILDILCNNNHFMTIHIKNSATCNFHRNKVITKLDHNNKSSQTS